MTSRLAVKHATSGCAKTWPVCVIAAEMRQVSKQAWLQLYQCCLLALKEAYIPCADQMVPRPSDSRSADSGSDGFSSQSGVNCMQVIYLQILTSQSCACPSAQVCHSMINNRCVSVIRLTGTVVDDPQTICLDDCPNWKSPWLRVITPCPKQFWTAESAGALVRLDCISGRPKTASKKHQKVPFSGLQSTIHPTPAELLQSLWVRP